MLLAGSTCIWARNSISASRYELLSGSKRNSNPKQFWDRKYSAQSYIFGKAPAQFIADNYEYLPMGAKVLDMGMGEGRNAVFLARKGYQVTGIDISSVAIKKSRMLATEFGVRINAILGSLDEYKFAPSSFDAIICFYYVDRSLNKKILKWLKPGGILVFEAHTDLQAGVKGSENYEKKYMLRPGELLNMFPDMQILKYEEPLHKKEFTASIILKKIK